uniref:Uncharacterized protein n=2 Tax=Tetraselmis chuii TaxID=63592 RepID=A0A7S1X4L9_9CHLO|mmetsp:Transcript_27875/g.49822  ORF Transcript_27875/g.49822 Transcript_27875/m.49822 type:complete len:214 (+) Transcript_27875:303-944(+)
MAANPALVSGYNGELLPAPFQGEYIVCRRDAIEVSLDGVNARKGKWTATGALFLSNFRLIYIAKKEDDSGLRAFDLPLAYIRKEDFAQPIFGCNHLKGLVWPVGEGMGPGGSAPPHQFKLYFKEGGAGTFLPIYFNLLFRARPRESESMASASQPSAPPATFGEVNKMVATAFVDPNDPTKIYLSQPVDESQRLQTNPVYAANYGKDEKYEPM